MVAWRFAIRVRLEYRGEHDQDEDQPLGRGNRPSDGPSEADTHVCGSFGGFSRRRANAHRSGAGQRGIAFCECVFRLGTATSSTGDSAGPQLVLRSVAERPVATCYVVLYPGPFQTQ